MSEGRRTQVVLLDERRLDIVVQPRLYVHELFSIVASYCHLKDPDKQYFGLAFIDDKGHYHWLQRDRRVLDHEFPRKFLLPGATLVLYHSVKFFVDSVLELTHSSTVELYFLHAKRSIRKGCLELSEDDVPLAGAFILQFCFGDFEKEKLDSRDIRRALCICRSQAKDRIVAEPSAECERQTLVLYRELESMSRGDALLKCMALLEGQATYGMHFYSVRDKAGLLWTLGINNKGIFQFPPEVPFKLRKVFQWKQLENLYYRDKKFSVEVNDPRRVVHTLSSFNLYEDAIQEAVDGDQDDLSSAVRDPTTQVSVSRRAFVPSSVQVQIFFCETPQLCKTIWSVAIAQHQFYLDRRSMKKSGKELGEERWARMAEKLSGMSVSGGRGIVDATLASPSRSATSDLGSSVSSHSLPSLQTQNIEQAEDERQKELQLFRALKLKKAALEQALTLKLKDLKETCIKEGELTGELPKEIRRTLAPGEAEPKIKRRVGTSFCISDEIVNKHTKADEMTKVEADVEIQRKIVAAALKLSTDKSINKSVRRKRYRDYQQAHQKLKELENQVHHLRLSASKPDLPSGFREDNRAWPNFYGFPHSMPSTPNAVRAAQSAPSTPRNSIPDIHAVHISSSPIRSHSIAQPPSFPNSAASSPVHRAAPLESPFELDNPHLAGSVSSLPIYENVGYKTSSAYQSSYRSAQYPTLPNPISRASSTSYLTPEHRTHSEHSLLSLASQEPVQPLPDFRVAGGEAVDHEVGAYNVPHQRTSWNYDSVAQGLNRVDSGDSVSAKPPVPKIWMVSRGPRRTATTRPDAPIAPDYCTGSLDRRLLKNRRGRFGAVHCRLPPPPPSPTIRQLDHSPSRVRRRPSLPRRPSPPIQGQSPVPGVESSKPYETADVLKYSRRPSPRTVPPSPSPTPPHPPSFAARRTPPPPYIPRRSTPSRTKLNSPNLPMENGFTLGCSSDNLKNDMLAWYDDQESKPKTATIV